jgi:hypothetical protein
MTSIRDSEVKDLKIGDVIYECEYGMNIEVRVVSVPVGSESSDALGKRQQWAWIGENTQTGDRIEYLLTEGLSHYGPRLYRQPQYIRINRDGSVVVPLLGGPDRAPERVSA